MPHDDPDFAPALPQPGLDLVTDSGIDSGIDSPQGRPRAALFSITLPHSVLHSARLPHFLAQGDAHLPRAPLSTPCPALPMATSPQSHILLVDDEPANLFLMQELLELEGYRVSTASDGPTALSQTQQDRPDLILLDVMMPGMNGFEVCDRLRLDPTFGTIPIIFLTALDDDDSRIRGVEALGDDYLTKPIRTELVLKKVQSLLRLQQLRTEHSSRALAAQTRQFQQLQAQQARQLSAVQNISEALAQKFQLFVPPQFLQRIAPRGVESIQVGNATESEMTVLFCDIRDFTKVVEFQEARETFQWLNALFEQFSQAITQHYGFVDKYLGDAVMAVFDRPGHHGEDGLRAALAICGELERFNQQRDRFSLQEGLRLGIGVHSGIGIIGTVGSQARMDTTVVGDVVNTASRLEEMTKTYRCQILTSAQTLAQLPEGHPFCLRWVDEAPPRGKQTPLTIYELLGLEKGNITP